MPTKWEERRQEALFVDHIPRIKMRTLLHCALILFFLTFYVASLQVLAGPTLDDDDGRVSLSVGGSVVGASDMYKIYSRPRINCNFACSRRCRKASRMNVCMRACGTCCSRCQCVPAGTFGNHNMCPCYASLKTHGGKRKCP